jgi:hypothetical protein
LPYGGRRGWNGAICHAANWLFLTSYKKQRESLLKNSQWNLLARLGEGGFDSAQAAGAFTILVTLTNSRPVLDGLFRGIDASEEPIAASKARILKEGELVSTSQSAQLANPDARILLEDVGAGPLLEKFAIAPNGMHAGDAQRYRLQFWEVQVGSVWSPFQCAVDETTMYGGRDSVFFWPNGGKAHQDNPNARIQGQAVWGRQGIVVRVMRNLPVTLYGGNLFDISCVPITSYGSSTRSLSDSRNHRCSELTTIVVIGMESR